MPQKGLQDGALAGLVDRLRAAGCVHAEEEAALLVGAARTHRELEAMTSRRVAGHPLEHVVGWASFAGHRVLVADGVFVPRRRSELLVEVAGRLGRRGGVLVELCCGSGALTAALAPLLAPTDVHAADVDEVAVRCASQNLHHLGVRLHRGDLYAPLPTALHGAVDVLVASPPYVPSDEVDRLPREARLHEPRTALDGGADGLGLLSRIVEGAPTWLAAGGQLFLECSAAQADPLARACERSGLTPAVHRDDEGDATVVAAR